MSNISSTIVGSVWGSGGTVDTHVLGTCLVRGEGSSPFSPTKGYVECYVTDTLVTLKRKGVLVVQGFLRNVSLRNYPLISFNAQVKNILDVTCVFLKYQPLHLCDSYVTKRNHSNVTIYRCNN